MKSCFILMLLILSLSSIGQEIRELTVDRPAAVVDLKTDEGVAMVQACWYKQPAQIRNVQFRSPGPSANDALLLYPTGISQQTNLVYPQVTSPDFEQGFVAVKPNALEERQGTGLNSFFWYKVELTVPEKIGAVPISDASAVFEITVDDYSEVWVNGKQTRGFGQIGNGVISGYNARNRILLSDHLKKGDKFSIVILGVNGPIGNVPDNYIWVRNAVIDFYRDIPTKGRSTNSGSIYRIDKELNTIIPSDAAIEKVAEGFSFTEGPVWHPDGFLLFSDPNTNSIYRYDPDNKNVTIYLSHSGYTGADIGEFGQPGSNGLTIDREGRLIVAQHGNRRVVRHEKKGPVTILVDRIDGKRLNSPNDLVLRSDGALYITDPPYGLPKSYFDARKELSFQGVILYKNGKTQVVATDCGGPNGIALSPDEKFLYVTNWDTRDIHHTKTIWRYQVNEDGTLHTGKIFYDMNQTEDEEALDGMKIDKEGNLFVSAPGGIWIISAQGILLGKIVTPERPANMAWGDADGRTLYMTAHSSLYKIRVATGGKFSWQ
jgi:gluconolactonase